MGMNNDANAPAGWDAARVNAEVKENPVDALADAVLGRILSRAGTRTVFGEPVTQGDVTIVPVAKVSTRFGFGGGSGSNPAKTPEETPSTGSGMGGGGDLRAKPLGYIEITPDGSRFMPIEDGMEIGLVTMKFIGVAIVLVALRFLLGGRGRGGTAREQAAERAARFSPDRLRVVRAVPWGAVASAATASRGRMPRVRVSRD